MAASSSTAVSTSTSLNPGKTSNSAFDVFLNHRGPDVKKTFASYLYRRLTSYGLKVFLDREELREGEYFNSEIKGAIRTASVHVAIFSAGYADSTWCLNELVMMLESGAKIIPVFYEVEPSDLRWTQGKDTLYAQSLMKLGEKTEYEAQTDPQSPQKKLRYNAATIEKWRNALSEVSGISGFDLKACNGKHLKGLQCSSIIIPLILVSLAQVLHLVNALREFPRQPWLWWLGVELTLMIGRNSEDVKERFYTLNLLHCGSTFSYYRVCWVNTLHMGIVQNSKQHAALMPPRLL